MSGSYIFSGIKSFPILTKQLSISRNKLKYILVFEKYHPAMEKQDGISEEQESNKSTKNNHAKNDKEH